MIAAWATLALATPTYPAALAELADAPCDPPCTLCHATSAGGAGTVVTPFGVGLRAAGLVANDEGALEDAWSAVADHDTDGDGLPDGEALAAGLDPSTGEPFCALDRPVYGCFSHAGAPPTWGAAVLALLLVRRRARGVGQPGVEPLAPGEALERPVAGP